MSLTDRLGELLPLLDRAFPTDLVAVLDEFLRETTNATDVTLYLADYSLRELRPISVAGGGEREAPTSLSITGSDPGKAYLADAPMTIALGDQLAIYVPVVLRDERLGVLGVVLPEPVSADTVNGLEQAAAVLAYVLLAAGRYTDVYEHARRREPLSLEAEVQWGLQPVRAFGYEQLSLAGQLVPAYDVGGDSYDWVVNHHVASVAALDAMGHGLNASMLGALALTAMRNARRAGKSLADRFTAANGALCRQFGGTQFVTAIGVEINLDTGDAVAVNAGHPTPLRLRRGEVAQIKVEPDLPMGLFDDTTYETHHLELDRGDRLMLLSDGVLDAESPSGQIFGNAHLQAALLTTSDEPPHEAVRQLVRTLVDFSGRDLSDDATLLIFDWHGLLDVPQPSSPNT